MEIFAKIINNCFYKELHLRCFTGFWIRLCFGNLSSLWLNRIPSVQITIQNSKSFYKFFISYCCEHIRLRFERVPRSVSAELNSHNIALSFTTNRPARKTRQRVSSERFSERNSVYKSNLNRPKVWWTEGDIKYNSKDSHKRQSFCFSWLCHKKVPNEKK